MSRSVVWTLAACAWISIGLGATRTWSQSSAGAEPSVGPNPQAIQSIPELLAREELHDHEGDAASFDDPASPDEAPSSPADTLKIETAETQHAAAAREQAMSLGAQGSRTQEAGLALPGDEGAGESAGGMLGSLDPRTNEFVRVMGALAIVIGLILLLRAAVRRMGGPMLNGGKPSGVLLVLARYPVGRGQNLVLLKLGRRLLLCHQAKGEMATLCEIQGEDEVAAMLARIEAGSRGKDADRFEKLLAEFNHEHRRKALPSRTDGADMRQALANAPVIDLTRKAGATGTNWLKLRKVAS